jgi:plasmid stabilization system protein ParE
VADVRFHPEAQDEYQVSLAWYQARSPQAADRFEAEVERVLGLIAANPAGFPRYDEGSRFAMLRRFPFSVVYQAEPDGRVEVVAVAHARRRPGYWEDRR